MIFYIFFTIGFSIVISWRKLKILCKKSQKWRNQFSMPGFWKSMEKLTRGWFRIVPGIGLPRLNFFIVKIDFRSYSGLGLSETTPRWVFPCSFRIWHAKLHIFIFWYIFIDLKMQIFIKFLEDLYRDKVKKNQNLF